MAKFLAPSDLGLYGLLAVTVGYALFVVGLDFYTYSTRELLGRDRNVWGRYLKGHAALCVTLYIVLMPAALFLFFLGLLPWDVLPWFIVLLVLEHINQELGRILVAVGQPLVASLILFFRSGSWAVIITALMFSNPKWRTLEYVFLAWAVGASIGIAVGLWHFVGLGIGRWRDSVDWIWVRRGIAVAIPFVLATLALRGLFTLDRYWFQALADLQVLGAYVLFGGISSALMAFLDAGVFSFIYPELIKACQRQDPKAFKKGMRRLFVQTVVLSFGFVVTALIVIQPLLVWLDNPLYLAQLHLFPWILAGALMYALGMIPHYALYAQSLDRPIIRSHLISLIVFVVSTGSLSVWFDETAVPMGLCVAFFFILCWKTWSFFRLTPAHFRSTCPVDSQVIL